MTDLEYLETFPVEIDALHPETGEVLMHFAIRRCPEPDCGDHPYVELTSAGQEPCAHPLEDIDSGLSFVACAAARAAYASGLHDATWEVLRRIDAWRRGWLAAVPRRPADAVIH